MYALRDQHAALFGLYSEETLHRAALELFLGRSEAPAIAEIAFELRARGADDGPWLVATPLSNVALDRPWAPLGDNAGLGRVQDSTPSLEDDAAARAEFEVFHHLGDRLPPASRVLRLGSGETHDTGRTATILSFEHGPPTIAIDASRAKVQYALATWSLLAPPSDWHLLPELGVWAPQPYIYQQAQFKPFEQDQWIQRAPGRGGSYRHWTPYDLPTNDVLAAPFEAFAALDHRPAQALLSGTAALHSATRASRSRLSERVRDVRSAIESLCEPGGGGRVGRRWDRLAERFGVWDRIAEARAYGPETVTALQQRIINARNISTHGADAALIDLGWNAGDRLLRNGKRAPATDLAATAVYRDLGPLIYAVGEALRGAWAAMRAADFDDDAFEALF